MPLYPILIEPLVGVAPIVIGLLDIRRGYVGKPLRGDSNLKPKT
jgi:hypothetical protein